MRVRIGGGVAACVGFMLGAVIAVVAFGGARADASQRALFITTTPAGAGITLDDERTGASTPAILDVKLGDGEHTVKLALATGAPAVRKFSLTNTDRGLALNENLQSSGTVVVRSLPPKARVILDGDDVGMTPLTLPGVSTDKAHTVELRANGYHPKSAVVPLDRPAEFTIKAVLESQRPQAKLTIVTAVATDVELNGYAFGTSGEERDCPAGRYEVVVRNTALGVERRVTLDVPDRGAVKFFVNVN